MARSKSATIRPMTTIPQRELRNRVSDVLRRAQQGEHFVITVDGRPVAELGPHRPRRWVGRDRLRSLMAEPAVPTLLDDVRRLEGGLPEANSAHPTIAAASQRPKRQRVAPCGSFVATPTASL